MSVTSLTTFISAVSFLSGFVGTPPTVATFSIFPLISFTSTINVLSIVSLAPNSTFHEICFLLSVVVVIFPLSVTELSINSVPAGTVSSIVVFPDTSPVFVAVIVYFILSPNFATSRPSFTSTLSLSTILLDFLAFIIDVFSSLLSLPLTIAAFDIVPIAFSLTFTVNLTSIDSFAGTVTIHFNPITTSFSNIVVPEFCASSIETKVVCSGILSVISIFFNSCSPLFVTLIVYVIFLLAYTNLSSPTPVVAVFSTVKSGIVGTIVSETADAAEASTLAGVHQSQKSFDTSFSSSSTLVTVVSPTSFTSVPVVTSVLFVALFTLPLFAVTLFVILFVVPLLLALLLATVPLLSGAVTLFCAPVFGSAVVLSGVTLFSPV